MNQTRPHQVNNDTTIIEILELHPFEMQLIHRLRKSLKFGEMTITVRDGLPVKITRIVEVENLTG